ncbi:hypothetical protein SNE40_015440 [Patella caerulea]|uniref:Centromere protein S n=1 Tax=Patella caerulea TaxID=87958 RepID=A0AAN8JFP5_PATCE
MASSTSNTNVEEEYEDLAYKQRMKASVYYTVLQLCKEAEVNMEIKINKQVTAAIAETTCKQFEHFAADLELFAKHGKRTTINTDDVKLLVRKTPKLLEHLNSVQEENPSKTVNKGKKKTVSNKSKKKSTTVDEVTTIEEVDLDPEMDNT